MKTRLNKLLRFILSFLPSKLPTGLTEMTNYCTEVIQLAGRGIPDNDSTRFAILSMIAHNTSPLQDRKPKRVFVRMLRKAAANEVAVSEMQRMRDLKKAEVSNVKPI